ncbi:MAG TPA: PBP1A family penicillin-binding protein [Longimicrobiales bacterium]
MRELSPPSLPWRSLLRRVLRSRTLWLLLILCVALAALSWERCGIAGCPDVTRLAAYQPGNASVLLDREGRRFADLSPARHPLVRLEDLPEHVPAAFLAVEDKRFYEHEGVDWWRVPAAALANLLAGEVREGFSTITMQLARNVFAERLPARERTLWRKLLEMRVAREIEERFTKDEILELYLNHIYFGNGAYGIESAARQYFGRSAKSLSLEQAALLAALPRAPSYYDPRRRPEEARARRDLVLSLMVEQGRIDAEEAEKARGRPLRLAAARETKGVRLVAPYYVQVVRELLEEELGAELYRRPLRITTAIDLEAQRAAEEELERQIRRVENGAFGRFTGPRLARHDASSPETEYLQGAAVVLDARTGDVLALVGGRNYAHSSYNRAVLGRRQTGSAFKPFVYAAALGHGYRPSDWLEDTPYRLAADGKVWEPQNYDGRFTGYVTLHDALVYSRNVPSVRLAEAVGPGEIVELARRAGFRGELRRTPMLALGIAEATPLELTAAYTAFAADGRAAAPRFILRVEDADGRVLWEPEAETREVMERDVARQMTELLADVVEEGTGRAVRGAGYRGPAAGKTGTTDDWTDAWFVGYTTRRVAGIWIGFDQPRPIAARATGGTAPAAAWGAMMRRIAGDEDWWPWWRPRWREWELPRIAGGTIEVPRGWLDALPDMLLRELGPEVERELRAVAPDGRDLERLGRTVERTLQRALRDLERELQREQERLQREQERLRREQQRWEREQERWREQLRWEEERFRGRDHRHGDDDRWDRVPARWRAADADV